MFYLISYRHDVASLHPPVGRFAFREGDQDSGMSHSRSIPPVREMPSGVPQNGSGWNDRSAMQCSTRSHKIGPHVFLMPPCSHAYDKLVAL